MCVQTCKHRSSYIMLIKFFQCPQFTKRQKDVVSVHYKTVTSIVFHLLLSACGLYLIDFVYKYKSIQERSQSPCTPSHFSSRLVLLLQIYWENYQKHFYFKNGVLTSVSVTRFYFDMHFIAIRPVFKHFMKLSQLYHLFQLSFISILFHLWLIFKKGYNSKCLFVI